MKKYEKAVDFLNEHPALNVYNGSFFSQFTFWTNEICKNGEHKDSFLKDPNKVTVSFYRGSDGFEKYKDEYFDDEDGREEEYDFFDSVDVPYKVVYGYEWELDKYQYAGEFCIFRFDEDSLEKHICVKETKDCKIGEEFSRMRLRMLMSNISEETLKENFILVKKDIREDSAWLRDRMHYNAYQGEYVKADTWEEMIIGLAEKAKENYGDYEYRDFLTKEEVDNNENEECFWFEPCEDDEVAGHKGCSRMISNPKYISVSDAEHNMRWWEWYKTTEHFEKSWKSTLENEEMERQVKQ